MMDVKEYTGKSVDDAIEKALKELRVTRDDVEIKIKSIGSAGILGFIGRKHACVEVSLRKAEQVNAQRVIEDILEIMRIDASISVMDVDDEIHITIGENGSSLIGYRGQTLNAFQYLVNRIVGESRTDAKKIIIDIDGYRQKREETLKGLAQRAAKKAIAENRTVEIGSMSSGDRRIIHMTLKGNNAVETFSRGSGSNRRVIVAPKGLKVSKSNNNGGNRSNNNNRRRPPRRRNDSGKPPYKKNR